MQWLQRNVQKSVLHVQSCCFANQTYCFFDVLAAVAVVVAKAPYQFKTTADSLPGCWVDSGKGNCDIISSAATVLSGVPFPHLLTLIVFFFLIPVSRSYSVSKQKKKRRKACKEGLLSVPLCGWTSNSSQQLKRLSEAVILQLVGKKRSGVQDFSVQALEVAIWRTWPSHMDNTSANQRRIPILSLSLK